MDELDNIHYVGQISQVLSGTIYDNIFNTSSSPSAVANSWSPDISVLHHWTVLTQHINNMQNMQISQKLDYCLEMINRADIIYDNLTQNGINFDTTTNDRHLREWRQALLNFRTRVGV